MGKQFGSSKLLALALTLLISSCMQYHVTHVCGTTAPNGGGTTIPTPKLNITTINAQRNLLQQVDSLVSMRIIGTTNAISTNTRNDTNAGLQSGETVLKYKQSRNLYNNYSSSVRGTNGTGNSKFLSIKKQVNSVEDTLKDPDASEEDHQLHKLVESGAETDTGGFTEEEVTGRYYNHEEDATGTNVKGRKYNKHRIHYKQTYKDGPDSGGPGHHTVASDAVINSHPVQPATIMMVGNPNTMKGYNDQTSNGNRNGNRKKEKTDLMSRILPMMIMPFLISTSLIPMMLTSLKFMLLKSLFVGKLAIVLLVINALWRIDNKGGVYSHNVQGPFGGVGGGMFGGHSGGYNDKYGKTGMEKDLNMAHYGFNGDMEYGAYVNHRR